MLTYVLWYFGLALLFLFIDALRCVEEMKKMDTHILILSITLVGLFWPLFLLIQVFTFVVVMAVKLHSLFTKGLK